MPPEETLHVPCLSLLEALMACPELFAVAHQAECQENVLLAAAELLVIPSALDEPGGEDSLERQECRVAALRVFNRCSGTASLDLVLPLRAEEDMDTVLQRLVLLCHHDLLCLLMYGNPWHSTRLAASRQQRLQSVELSLFLLSSYAWQLCKDGPEPQTSEKRQASSRAARNQLGRTQVLVPSIVEMVGSVAASDEEFEPLLGSASALRMLEESSLAC
eukprot:g8673.t1